MHPPRGRGVAAMRRGSRLRWECVMRASPGSCPSSFSRADCVLDRRRNALEAELRVVRIHYEARERRASRHRNCPEGEYPVLVRHLRLRVSHYVFHTRILYFPVLRAVNCGFTTRPPQASVQRNRRRPNGDVAMALALSFLLPDHLIGKARRSSSSTGRSGEGRIAAV